MNELNIDGIDWDLVIRGAVWGWIKANRSLGWASSGCFCKPQEPCGLFSQANRVALLVLLALFLDLLVTWLVVCLLQLGNGPSESKSSVLSLQEGTPQQGALSMTPRVDSLTKGYFLEIVSPLFGHWHHKGWFCILEWLCLSKTKTFEENWMITRLGASKKIAKDDW